MFAICFQIWGYHIPLLSLNQCKSLKAAGAVKEGECMNNKKNEAALYYNRFSKVYDLVSSDHYYRKVRQFAIDKLNLSEDQTILNIPCGTGQNFRYFNEYLNGTGIILGFDLSMGMLAKAEQKIESSGWSNISLKNIDAGELTSERFNILYPDLKADAVLCDLGLSGFPQWEKVIDNLLGILKPGGRFIVMDWYIEKPNFRAWYISYLGRGEVDRPIPHYLESRLSGFEFFNQFKKGELFVAAGTKRAV